LCFTIHFIYFSYFPLFLHAYFPLVGPEHNNKYCGIFFPEAVRYQAMAAKEISKAKQYQLARNISSGHQSAEQALGAYKEAAKRWRSGDDVNGVATPLDLAVRHLRSLSRADGVVEVCLIASKNFEVFTQVCACVFPVYLYRLFL
jgi:hypothetical protein